MKLGLIRKKTKNMSNISQHIKKWGDNIDLFRCKKCLKKIIFLRISAIKILNLPLNWVKK